MRRLFLFLLCTVLLSSCKKDPETTRSKTELLTSENWRVTASTTTTIITGSNPSTKVVDNYALSQACEKDNFYKFKTDKTFLQDEGLIKCTPGIPQTGYFTWDFNSDQTKLLMIYGGVIGTNTVDLVELSASTMRWRITDSFTTVGNSTITTVFDVTLASF